MPTILTKKSDTPGAVPATANLTNAAGGAELAVNTADKRLFTLTSGSAVVELGTNPTTLSTASLTVSTGNLTFSGTAQRITGDMSNATVSNRLAFQTSTTNDTTSVTVLPNGTSRAAQVLMFNTSDATNAAYGGSYISQFNFQIDTGITGTGTYVPMLFRTGGSERMRLDTSGRLGLGTAAPSYKLTIADTTNQLSLTTGTNELIARASSTEAALYTFQAIPLNFYTNNALRATIDSSGNVGIGNTVASTINTVNGVGNLVVGSGSGSEGITIYTGTADTGGIAFADGTTTTDTYRGYINYAHATDHMAFWTSASEKMRIDSSGNVGIGTTSLGGFFGTVNLGGSGNPGSGFLEGWMNSQSIPSSVTTRFDGFISIATTAAASFTLTGLRHFTAQGATKGAGSTITSQFGFYVDNTLTGATNNFGFYSDIASGSNRWNFYANGTARNYFAGGVEDAAGNLRAIPRTGSAKTSVYTLTVSDVGQFVELGTGGGIDVPNGVFSTGDVVSVFNNTSGNTTISLTITTAYIGGTDADKASVTLATRGVATVLFISNSVCVLTGNVS